MRIGWNGFRQARPKVDGEANLGRLGDVTECPLEERRQLRHRPIGDLQRDSSGLDLRQVEDVVDQLQEVGSGRTDDGCVLDLFRQQVSVRVIGELLREDQQAVEGRPQLV